MPAFEMSAHSEFRTRNRAIENHGKVGGGRSPTRTGLPPANPSLQGNGAKWAPKEQNRESKCFKNQTDAAEFPALANREFC